MCICQCVYTYTIPREPIYDIFHALQLLCIYTKKSYTMELYIYINIVHPILSGKPRSKYS